MPLAPDAGAPLPLAAPPFTEYRLDAAYDEMFDTSAQARPHYAELVRRLSQVSAGELQQRQASADQAFLNLGITFTVYGTAEGTERIFPYDLLPRLVTGAEWDHIERGLAGREDAVISRTNEIDALFEPTGGARLRHCGDCNERNSQKTEKAG